MTMYGKTTSVQKDHLYAAVHISGQLLAVMGQYAQIKKGVIITVKFFLTAAILRVNTGVFHWKDDDVELLIL